MTQFKAYLHRAVVDRDGEWSVTLKVPQSDGPKIAELALYTEVVFDVTVVPEGEGRA